MFISSLQEMLKALNEAITKKKVILQRGIIEKITKRSRQWGCHLLAQRHNYSLQPYIKR